MRRVVVTGLGIVSPIGNDIEQVMRSLRQGQSGIEFVPELKELGYRCPAAGTVKQFNANGLGKRALQTMSDVSRYAAVAAREALTDAGIEKQNLNRRRVGVVVGTAVGGSNEVVRAERLLHAQKEPAQLGAEGLMKIMNSTAALNLAAWLGIKGRSYSVSTACSTGTDNIGHAFELIRHGVLDVCICGGAEETGARNFWAFGDALQATPPLSETDRPEHACRPFDRDRQGMVPSYGAGVLILEELETAIQRRASTYAEVLAYTSADDGAGVFEPNGRGLKQCLQQALEAVHPVTIDYVNPHGPGTRLGDSVEVRVIREVFGQLTPLVSSTKALTGHPSAAAGAHEAIYTLLMLRHGFVVPTANLEHVGSDCQGIRHVRSFQETPLKTALSYSAGLGGFNACLVFTKR